MPPTEGFDLVAEKLAQRNPKLRDFDTKSVVDLQFVREARGKQFSEKPKGELIRRIDKSADRNVNTQDLTLVQCRCLGEPRDHFRLIGLKLIHASGNSR